MEKSLRLFLNSRLVKSMPDTLTIQTSGEVVMGTKQAIVYERKSNGSGGGKHSFSYMGAKFEELDQTEFDPF